MCTSALEHCVHQCGSLRLLVPGLQPTRYSTCKFPALGILIPAQPDLASTSTFVCSLCWCARAHRTQWLTSPRLVTHILTRLGTTGWGTPEARSEGRVFVHVLEVGTQVAIGSHTTCIRDTDRAISDRLRKTPLSVPAWPRPFPGVPGHNITNRTSGACTSCRSAPHKK